MSGALPLGVVLAGARARGAVLAPFGAVVSVVTAPLVAGLSLTDVRTTLQVCAPLLVLAGASLPELGAELAAARRTAPGSSHAPGTQMRSTSSRATPWRRRASSAPSARARVICSLKRLATIARRWVRRDAKLTARPAVPPG